jgi:hypothetical protein
MVRDRQTVRASGILVRRVKVPEESEKCVQILPHWRFVRSLRSPPTMTTDS